MSKVLKTILIILAALVSLTGLGFLFYSFDKKKKENTISIKSGDGKAEFKIDDFVKIQPQMIIEAPSNLTFNLTNGTTTDPNDEFYIVRARNTSKESSLDKIWLLDFYNPKTGVWGYDKNAHLTEVEANKQFAKITNAIAFKGIPQSEVEVYIVPKWLLVINANTTNNFSSTNYRFAEVNEPNIFQGEFTPANVVLFTGGIYAWVGLFFGAVSATVGGFLAISGVVYSATRLAWIRSFTHKAFKRIVVFKKP